MILHLSLPNFVETPAIQANYNFSFQVITDLNSGIVENLFLMPQASGV